MRPPLRLYALESGADFARRVAHAVDVDLEPVEERVFEDGEMKVRAERDPRGADAFVVQSLDGGLEGSVHDRLCRALMLVGSLTDAGAARVTGVFPYLAYARKDRRTKANDPLTLRYVAQMFEAVGLDAVVAFEVHEPAAFENAFRIPKVALDPRELFTERLCQLLADERLVVVSPDPGGLKRAQLFEETLRTRHPHVEGRAILDKRRSAGVVSGELLAGEVEGAVPVIIDDLISSGGTIARGAEALVAAGAAAPWVAVAHGVFSPDAAAKLGDAPLAQLLVTDSVQPPRLDRTALPILETVDCAPLMAAAIKGLHDGRPIDVLTRG
jgi:ribose-phosphate pyrophosphokinase